jgi:hypothetical protein
MLKVYKAIHVYLMQTLLFGFKKRILLKCLYEIKKAFNCLKASGACTKSLLNK